MIIITSAAYVDPELVSDIGLLPPAFLPVGNRRLYELQVELLREWFHDQDIFLSLPKCFSFEPQDAKALGDLNIKLIRVDGDLSLGASIEQVWEEIGIQDEPLTILHGDTLFRNCPAPELDSLTVHENRGFYLRADLETGRELNQARVGQNKWIDSDNEVASGCFRFSEPKHFISNLNACGHDFMVAVDEYFLCHDMATLRMGEWLDFGHLNSYYQSRTRLTTERAFNSLKIVQGQVLKVSQSMADKTKCEAFWFDKLPPRLRMFTPQFLGPEVNGYRLEYLHLMPLSDLLVYGRLSDRSWSYIFKKIREMLDAFKKHDYDNFSVTSVKQAQNLYAEKTFARIHQYYVDTSSENKTYSVMTANGLEKMTLLQVAKETLRYIPDVAQSDIGIIHGDLCFSNILFDTRAVSIKCIDPRGYLDGYEPTLFGDVRYDLAKLYHSVIGSYDFAVSGRLAPFLDDDPSFLNSGTPLPIRERFEELVLEPSGYTTTEIHAICTLLFLSMLPLHFDSPARQRQFIGIALSLAGELFSGLRS